MLKVFAIQKAFSGFSRMISFPDPTFSPTIETSQVNHYFVHPITLLSSLFMLMPPKADLLGSL